MIFWACLANFVYVFALALQTRLVMAGARWKVFFNSCFIGICWVIGVRAASQGGWALTLFVLSGALGAVLATKPNHSKKTTAIEAQRQHNTHHTHEWTMSQARPRVTCPCKATSPDPDVQPRAYTSAP